MAAAIILGLELHLQKFLDSHKFSRPLKIKADIHGYSDDIEAANLQELSEIIFIRTGSFSTYKYQKKFVITEIEGGYYILQCVDDIVSSTFKAAAHESLKLVKDELRSEVEGVEVLLRVTHKLQLLARDHPELLPILTELESMVSENS